jgi:hypothetical protein
MNADPQLLTVSHIAPCVPLPPLLHPQIEGVVQEDVCQKWRSQSGYAIDNFEWRSRIERDCLRARVVDDRRRRRP